MLAFIARRLAIAALTLLVISVLAFVVIQLPPGDYLSSYMARLQSQGDSVAQDQIEALREQYGLDRPLYVQYLKWIGGVLQGDFGRSLEWDVPVSDLLGQPLLHTIILASSAMLLTWMIALPIGVYSAVRQRSIGDYLFTFIGFLGLAIPDFMLALLLMFGCYSLFGINVSGLFSPEYIDAPWSWARVFDLFKHLWIPSLVLGASGAAALIRTLRANLVDELRKPYVVTARAKGLPYWKAVLKYPLRIALNPLVSTSGYILPRLISGSVIVSVVLSLPTVGPLLLGSLLSQDMYLAGAIILLLSALTVIGTLISDILLVLLDPRIRLGQSA
jgi:peptide/nickel transport system permease protein